MIHGIVFDIRKYSIHDGPGIRTTVFFKGCPLHCDWCHNPESRAFQPELIFRSNRCILCESCLEACPNGAITRQGDLILTDREKCKTSGECVLACEAEARQLVGRTMSVDQVMEEIEADRAFYDQSGGGVTFSGGEPLAQRAFLFGLLAACKARALHTTLDTSGYATWAVMDKIRGYVDLFLYDLKLMDNVRHRRYTGVSNQKILSNLTTLSELGHRIIIRIPVIPGINDDEANLRQTGAFLAALPVRPAVELLAYHQTGLAKYESLGLEYRLAEIQPPEPMRMEGIAEILRGSGLQVMV
ncbi:MAG: glycyl-radical enzyme activating protein [Anaerolineales bacterium]